jgi:hypothetical protein
MHGDFDGFHFEASARLDADRGFYACVDVTRAPSDSGEPGSIVLIRDIKRFDTDMDAVEFARAWAIAWIKNRRRNC